MLVNDAVEMEDEMNLDMDIVQAKTHVNTAYKRKRLDTRFARPAGPSRSLRTTGWS